MVEKELLEKNRFTEEEYKKKVKEQFHQMLEDIEMEEIRNVDIAKKYNCSRQLIGVWKHSLKKEGLIQ